MSKRVMKPGCMLAPVPTALVSCMDKEGNANLITLGWVGTVNTDPPMVTVSIRPSRYSHDIIEETGEFVINLTTEKMLKEVDRCGVWSGAQHDKWKECGFTKEDASQVKVPLVKESPINIECKVKEVKRLGSHDMYLAEVVAVDVDEEYFDKNDRLDTEQMKLVAYNHGAYYSMGRLLGTFGFSVRKKPVKKKK